MTRIPGRVPTLPPTLADVAERAGVSRQTVSNAVNNPDLLRPGLALRIDDALLDLVRAAAGPPPRPVPPPVVAGGAP